MDGIDRREAASGCTPHDRCHCKPGIPPSASRGGRNYVRGGAPATRNIVDIAKHTQNLLLLRPSLSPLPPLPFSSFFLHGREEPAAVAEALEEREDIGRHLSINTATSLIKPEEVRVPAVFAPCAATAGAVTILSTSCLLVHFAPAVAGA